MDIKIIRKIDERFKDTDIKFEEFQQENYDIVLFCIHSVNQDEAKLAFDELCETLKFINSPYENNLADADKKEIEIITKKIKPVVPYMLYAEDEPFIIRKIKELLKKDIDEKYFIGEIDYNNKKLINKRFVSVFAEFVGVDPNKILEFFGY